MDKMKDMEKSVLDWQTICGCLMKYWWSAVLVVALTAGIALVCVLGTPDKYQVSVVYYLDQTEQIVQTKKAESAAMLMKSSLILDSVNAELKENQMLTLGQGEEKIDCEVMNETDFFVLEVQGTDLKRENYIVDLMTNLYEEEITQIETLKTCKMVSRKEELQRAGQKEIILFIGFGVLLGCAVLLMIMLFNDKIWSTYDVQKCFAESYLGCYSSKDDWIHLMKYRCERDKINKLYIGYPDKGKKSKDYFEQISQMDKDIQVEKLIEISNEFGTKDAKAFLVIERGVSTYKNVNQTLRRLRGFDIEIAGCICI